MPDTFPLIFLRESGQPSQFTSKGSGGRTGHYPSRNRQTHSQRLLNSLNEAWDEAARQSQQRQAVSVPAKEGYYLEIRGAPAHDLVTKSLENKSLGIRLLNIRETDISKTDGAPATSATIFIPADKRHAFAQKIGQYANEETPKGEPKHANLVESIESIQLAVLESFWQDDRELIPTDQKAWCEIWLRTTGLQDLEAVEAFRKTCTQLNIETKPRVLNFPERTVLLIKVNRADLDELIIASPSLAEFRRAKETADFFLTLDNREQTEWVQNLRGRLALNNNTTVAVTVLDSGANNGHLLLQPVLHDDDRHAIDPTWGTDDHNGHGTAMCGLVAFGDLQAALESAGPIEVAHRLASVKILPPTGHNDPDLYGQITIQGVSRAEIQDPQRTHINCMAVASTDARDRGQPSSWSGAVDELTSGYLDDQPKLMILAAGNSDPSEWRNFPHSNLSDSVHDPGQSWNALTVGCYTEKTTLLDPNFAGYEPLAQAGELSPHSTTSLSWNTRKWPVKPDVVFEGGNLARSPGRNILDPVDLMLLTTSNAPAERQFDHMSATSAAAAQAAWMAARIQANYTHAWPETVRALMVQSARWTEAMKKQFLGAGKKTDYASLIRTCGYGVPDLQRAIYCTQSTLTLIAEETIQPFTRRASGSGYRTNEMHLHELPWPKDVLLSLGKIEVELRVTLSYFVEPSPERVGWQNRYRYASHAFRFDLNDATESQAEFVRRINKAAREEEYQTDPSRTARPWLIGSNGRDVGSIHSDILQTTAAELATCNHIAVFPIIGWWRERPWLGRWNRQARYSLVVSIETPEIDVDILTPVMTQLKIPITVSAEI